MVAFTALLLATLVWVPASASVPEVVARRPPNVVLILTDDLDVASVAAMPNVRRLIANQGLTFSNFFATTPLCCPSRASILRGQYAHNHGVLRNTGDEDAGFAAFHDQNREDSTLATWLQAAGYRTALFGKYLNGYTNPTVGRGYVPPGWDEWGAGIDHRAYEGFGYQLNENGRVVDYGRGANDYMTDVLAGQATSFVEAAATAGGPFFLYFAPYAPHAPSTPAPRHEGEFADAQVRRGPAFNEPDVRDKPRWVRSSPPLSDKQIARLDADQRQRLRSLQAVDEAVADLVRTLAASGELERTVILFTSDNGVFLGEHRQPHGKNAPYDPAIHVPLIVRGPGIAPGQSTAALALNIDLAPTIADLAGIAPADFVDGRSLAPLLQGETEGSGRQAFLAEGFGGSDKENGKGGGTPTPPFAALRTADLLYIEYETGERELYDLRRDPDQLKNLAKDTDRATFSDLSARLTDLRRCAAADCRQAEDGAPALAAVDRADRPSARAADQTKVDSPERRDDARDRNRNRTGDHSKGQADRRARSNEHVPR